MLFPFLPEPPPTAAVTDSGMGGQTPGSAGAPAAPQPPAVGGNSAIRSREEGHAVRAFLLARPAKESLHSLGAAAVEQLASDASRCSCSPRPRFLASNSQAQNLRSFVRPLFLQKRALWHGLERQGSNTLCLTDCQNCRSVCWPESSTCDGFGSSALQVFVCKDIQAVYLGPTSQAAPTRRTAEAAGAGSRARQRLAVDASCCVVIGRATPRPRSALRPGGRRRRCHTGRRHRRDAGRQTTLLSLFTMSHVKN